MFPSYRKAQGDHRQAAIRACRSLHAVENAGITSLTATALATDKTKLVSREGRSNHQSLNA